MEQHEVRFAAGKIVSAGMYRNVDTGHVKWFDGQTPLPGGVNAASWQQVSDHHHPGSAPAGGADAGREGLPTHAEQSSHPVRFRPGSVVSAGMYRNVDTGHTQYFDGRTPLPGGVNAASWQQVSDHHHADVASPKE